MAKVAEKAVAPVNEAEVRKYAELGHFGYILDYREAHEGNDPRSQDLDALAEKVETRRGGGISALVRTIIEVLT